MSDNTNNRAACAAQHFGAWLVDPQWHRQAVAAVNGGMLLPGEPLPALAYVLDGEGNARLPITGHLTKGRSSFGGTSLVDVAHAVRQADNDPAVKQIVLEIDSPGGTAAGTEAAARAVAKASKPTVAWVSDCAASGAYWIASQAGRVLMHPTAQVGSIGAYTVLVDDTGAQEQIGVKLRVISSGGLKGAGADGAVTDALIEDEQEQINKLTELFVAAVARGRRMSVDAVAALADGRMHFGADAVSLGLADRVVDADDLLTILNEEAQMDRETFIAYSNENPDLLKQVAEPLIAEARLAGSNEAKQLAEQAAEAAKPKPATAAELKAEFPDSPGFVIDQLEVNATMEQAKLAHRDELARQLADSRRDLEQTQAKLAEVDPGSAGRPPVNVGKPEPESEQPVSEDRRKQLLAQAGVTV